MASLWSLDDKGNLGLSSPGHVSDADVCVASQQLETFLAGQQGRITFPATISVHVEGKGFGDKGATALLHELLLLHQQGVLIINELFMFKLKLTDAICGPLADLIVAHKGSIESLHLSHNNITSVGAKLLCERIAVVYPIKSPDGGLLTPLWLRMEHNNINPSTLTLPPEMFTVKQHRLRKLKPPAPPLQLPHIGLGDPQASKNARTNGAGGGAARPPRQSGPGGGGGGGGGGGRKADGGEVGAEVGAVARAVFYDDGKMYPCRVGAATAKGRMCLFIGYEGDGWQDTFAKDIHGPSAVLGGKGGKGGGGKGGGKNKEGGAGGRGAGGLGVGGVAAENDSPGGKGGAVKEGAGGGRGGGGGGVGGGGGGARAIGTGANEGEVTPGGGGGKSKSRIKKSKCGASPSAAVVAAQMGGLSVSDSGATGPPTPTQAAAVAAGSGEVLASPVKEMTAVQKLEADVQQAQMLLRSSYRQPKDAEAALSNAVEARTLTDAALASFATAGDRANSFRCLAVNGEARMREGYVRVCRGEHQQAMPECCAKSVASLSAAAGMLDSLVQEGEGVSGLIQQLSMSLDMGSENVERCKRELAEKLADARDPGDVQSLRTALEAAISMSNDLAKLRR